MTPDTQQKQNTNTPVSRYFKRMSEYLALNAKKAYQEKDFQKRTEIIAKAVSIESSAMLCLSLGRMDVVSQVQEVLYKASIEMCSLYRPLFKKDGSPQFCIKDPKNADNEKFFEIFDYLTAIPGPLAKKHLKETLQVFGVNMDEEKILEMIVNIKFNELILLGALWLGFDEKEAFEVANLTPDKIKDLLYPAIDKNTYEINLIEHLSFNEEGYTLPLSSSQINFLETAIRLENCSWKSGQVHKALIEGTTERIETDKRMGVFNVDEEFRINQYNNLLEKFGNNQIALIRVAFDFYKSTSVLIRDDVKI